MALELTTAQRGFPDAQALLAGSPQEAWRTLPIGWHGTAVSRFDGSFALIGPNSGLDALVGRVVTVQFGIRQVYAYVLGTAQIDENAAISLTRRCYAFLARLGTNTITGMVAATGPTRTPRPPSPGSLGGLDGGVPSSAGTGRVDGGTYDAVGSGDIDGGSP